MKRLQPRAGLKRIGTFHYPSLKIGESPSPMHTNNGRGGIHASSSGKNSKSPHKTPRDIKRCLFNDDLALSIPKPIKKNLQVFFCKSQPRARQKRRIQMSTKSVPRAQQFTRLSIHCFAINSSKSYKDNATDQELLPDRELFRFLIHNTSAYRVRSLLCFICEKGKSVQDYHNSTLCRDVFGPVGLGFLEQVFEHRIPLMTYYRQYQRLGIFPFIERRVNNCLACTEKDGRCKCPALDVSVFLFCRVSCDAEHYDCRICKNWTVRSHLCYDFFFCEICEGSFKEAPTYLYKPSKF